MKILMIAPEPFFEPRGTPFSEYYRIRALSALGHEIDLTITDFVLSPQADYPLSGTIAFTIKMVQDEPGESNDFTFTISGSITFNGTNIVPVTFAGYNYTLNLDED